MNALRGEACHRGHVHAVVLLSAVVVLMGAHVSRRYLPLWDGTCMSPDSTLCTVVELEGVGVRSGVYFFRFTPTLADVCARAGGAKGAVIAQADELLASGALVTVSEGETGLRVHRGEMAVAKRLLFGIPLDLNEVAAEDLERVPGIGARLAGAIVGYRNIHGRFNAVDELEKVRGIGKKKMAAIRKYVKVEVE